MGTGNHDNALLPREPSGEFVLYRDEAGAAQVQVRLAENTVWLTQVQMASLYQTTKQNVSLHIRNILADRELDEEATVKRYLAVAEEGPRRVERQLLPYNLDKILAVGRYPPSPCSTTSRRSFVERSPSRTR